MLILEVLIRINSLIDLIQYAPECRKVEAKRSARQKYQHLMIDMADTNEPLYRSGFVIARLVFLINLLKDQEHQ